jgi:hypothetical protein
MSRRNYSVSQKALLLAAKGIIKQIGCNPATARDAVINLVRKTMGSRYWKFETTSQNARFIGLQYARGAKDIDVGFTADYVAICTGLDEEAASEAVAALILNLCDNLGYAISEEVAQEQEQLTLTL